MEATAHLVIDAASRHDIEIKTDQLAQFRVSFAPGVVNQKQVIRFAGEFGRRAETAILFVMPLFQLLYRQSRCCVCQFTRRLGLVEIALNSLRDLFSLCQEFSLIAIPCLDHLLQQAQEPVTGKIRAPKECFALGGEE